MKRFNLRFLSMKEHADGAWITYEDHNADYIRRWDASRNDYKIFYDKQYKDDLLIKQLKFAVASLVVLVILSLIV